MKTALSKRKTPCTTNLRYEVSFVRIQHGIVTKEKTFFKTRATAERYAKKIVGPKNSLVAFHTDYPAFKNIQIKEVEDDVI